MNKENIKIAGCHHDITSQSTIGCFFDIDDKGEKLWGVCCTHCGACTPILSHSLKTAFSIFKDKFGLDDRLS